MIFVFNGWQVSSRKERIVECILLTFKRPGSLAKAIICSYWPVYRVESALMFRQQYPYSETTRITAKRNSKTATRLASLCSGFYFQPLSNSLMLDPLPLRFMRLLVCLFDKKDFVHDQVVIIRKGKESCN